MTERPEFEYPDDRLYQNAGSLILSAHDIYQSLGVMMEVEDFIEAFVYPTRDFGEPTARKFFDEYAATVEATGEENSRDQRFILVRLACAHIGDAMRFADDGHRDDGWEALLMAQHTTATLEGIVKAEKKSPDTAHEQIQIIALAKADSIISERARKAADKAHVENRAVRAQAFEWLDKNFDRDRLTNDSAAEALGKIVPVALSTRLSYVKSWKRSR
ncbi:hypothetical protein [Burkholderia ubonensis]|nr:hypothetical protein [Burkholderia ubonensis]